MIKRIRTFTIPALAAMLLTAGFGWAQTVKEPVYAGANGTPTEVIVGYAELEDGDVVLEVELMMDAFASSFHTTIGDRVFEGTLVSGAWIVNEVLTDELREVVTATVEFDDDPLGRDDDHADDDHGDDDYGDDDYGDDDHDGRDDDMNDDDMNDDDGAHDGETEGGTDDDGDDADDVDDADDADDADDMDDADEADETDDDA